MVACYAIYVGVLWAMTKPNNAKKSRRTMTSSPRRVHDYPNDKNTMYTRHLNNLVSDRTNIGITRIESIMMALWDSILYRMAHGEVVIISNFGLFTLIRDEGGQVQVAFEPNEALIKKLLVGKP